MAQYLSSVRDGALKLFVRANGIKDALLQDEGGQDIIEYALVVALIAMAAVAAVDLYRAAKNL
jgi:Flp pilus assembly pilin Flp